MNTFVTACITKCQFAIISCSHNFIHKVPKEILYQIYSPITWQHRFCHVCAAWLGPSLLYLIHYSPLQIQTLHIRLQNTFMDTTYTILCRGDRGAALCKLPAAPALPACGSKIYLAPSAISHQHNKTSVSLRLQIHKETCSAAQSINFVLHELKDPLGVTHFGSHSQYPLK